LALRKSVLDSVSGDLQEISGRLGPDDNHKLDFHLTAVREAETKLSNLMTNHGTCASATQPKDYKSLAPGFANYELNLETYVPDMIDAMVGMIGAALKCGLTRVGSMQFGYGGGKWKWAWEQIGINHHDSIAHLDTIDDPGTTATALQTTAWVTTINQYYASVIRKLAIELQSSPEGAGNMLDNTLIVWSNEMGRGDHRLEDIPAVMIGLVGNGIKQGGKVYDLVAARGSQQPHNILGYHMLNALGHSTQGFGDIADMSSYAISAL
jgi:hypothetical protein